MTQINPFTQINDRFDQIESLISEIKTKVNRPQVSTQKERLTRKEIQSNYKVSLSTIHKLMKTGDLPYHKVGRKTLFKRQDVEDCFK